MTIRNKIIPVYSFLLLLIASILIGFFTTWYYSLIPAVLVALTEYALRCKQAKHLIFFSVARKEKEQPAPEPILPEPEVIPNIVAHIRDLKLRDFIACCVYGKLSNLGTGTPAQLSFAWAELMSQFYEVRNDKSMSNRIKLSRDIAAMELHRAAVILNSTILKERYSPAAAEGMRQLYPKFEFTPVSYLKDLVRVGNSEISKGLKLEGLQSELKRIEDAQPKTEAATKLDQEKKYRELLMDINHIEHGNYNADTMSAFDFAIALNRRDEHIANLNEQIRKNGSR